MRTVRTGGSVRAPTEGNNDAALEETFLDGRGRGDGRGHGGGPPGGGVGNERAAVGRQDRPPLRQAAGYGRLPDLCAGDEADRRLRRLGEGGRAAVHRQRLQDIRTARGPAP